MVCALNSVALLSHPSVRRSGVVSFTIFFALSSYPFQTVTKKTVHCLFLVVIPNYQTQLEVINKVFRASRRIRFPVEYFKYVFTTYSSISCPHSQFDSHLL